MEFFRKKSSSKIVYLFLFLYIAVALINDGFIAVDEYWEGITRYIPAQSTPLENISHFDDVKSPTQTLPMFTVAKVAYLFGVQSPITQYRLVILFFAMLASVIYVMGSKLIYRDEQKWILLLCSLVFHFASVGVLTRPMFEALSASWLFLAMACAYVYDQQKADSRYLLFGSIASAMAFAARPQTGMVSLVFLILPLIRKNWRQVGEVVVTGMVLFVLMGLPDLFIRGGFHHSLKAVVGFNIQHGGNYTNQPWWFYFPLIVVVTLLPWFIAKYPKSVWEDSKKMRVVWLGFILFLLPHLIFKNKFERFLIPAIPLLILLLQPFWQHLWFHFKQYKIRVISFLIVNFLLWFSISWMAPQKNMIGAVEFLDGHTQIKKAYVLSDAMDWLPDAFIGRKDLTITYLKVSEIAQVQVGCDAALIVGESEFDVNNLAQNGFGNKAAQFHVNWIESLAFKLNPKRNQRRQTLYALYPIDSCGNL